MSRDPDTLANCFDLTRAPGATDEHRQLRDAVRRFVEGELAPHAAAWDEAAGFPRELYRQAAQVGLLGLGYPSEHGGTPCDTLSRIIATIELTRAGSGGLIASLMSHTIMLGPLLKAGNPAVCGRVVPRILAGDAIGALAVTEASGGSDVARLTTRALPKTGGGWRLNGSKMFITSGMRADHYLVAARTGEPGARGISLFLVDRDMPGFSRAPLAKTGWWCSDTAALHFDDCPVDADRLVGPLDGGFALIMNNFNGERLMMAAQAIGFAIACCEDALGWARERRTFGQPLVGHQVIRHKLVRMVDSILPVLAWLAQLASRIDRGEAPVAEISLVKNHAARVMRDCADESVQILGGAGYMRGGRVERIYREVKVMMIGGGAEEVLNDLAARQLGLD
ncbi:MAG TPA: acyl-CoA dehydrogenase family protein [Burkholderiaceae bacterium]|jgi:acyl-CoA dehydrogenase|nr:acyl-CoA dehydrogenase family protein [Burkholderiaceae bacterium]